MERKKKKDWFTGVLIKQAVQRWQYFILGSHDMHTFIVVVFFISAYNVWFLCNIYKWFIYIMCCTFGSGTGFTKTEEIAGHHPLSDINIEFGPDFCTCSSCPGALSIISATHSHTPPSPHTTPPLPQDTVILCLASHAAHRHNGACISGAVERVLGGVVCLLVVVPLLWYCTTQ